MWQELGDLSLPFSPLFSCETGGWGRRQVMIAVCLSAGLWVPMDEFEQGECLPTQMVKLVCVSMFPWGPKIKEKPYSRQGIIPDG